MVSLYSYRCVNNGESVQLQMCEQWWVCTVTDVWTMVSLNSYRCVNNGESLQFTDVWTMVSLYSYRCVNSNESVQLQMCEQ